MLTRKLLCLSGFVIFAIITVLTQIPFASAKAANFSPFTAVSQWNWSAGALAFFNFQSADAKEDSDKSAPESCATLPPDLVSWYRSENNANDSQGTNNGTVLGTVTFVAGKVGQGFRIDAAGEQIAVPASASTNVGSGGAFTVETWISADNVGTQGGRIVRWRDISDAQRGVTFDRLGNISSGGILSGSIFGTNGISHPISTDANGYAGGAFEHIALTYSSTTGMATIYVNGVVKKTENFGSFTPQTTGSFDIGNGDQFDNRPFRGVIDELSIYNRALSQTEIESIFNAGSAGKCVTAEPLQISPATANANSGATVNFTASGGIAPYAFSILTNNSGGTINSSTGVYTAGNLAGTDIVRVTDAPGATADAIVNVPTNCVTNQKTWDGGGATNNWSEGANWTCDAVPTTSDTVFFNGTSTRNSTIDQSFTFRSLQVSAAYTGIITASDGVTMAVSQNDTYLDSEFGGGTFVCGAGSTVNLHNAIFKQSGGVINCQAGAFTQDHIFTLTSGTFNAPSGGISLNTYNQSGGTFNCNGGLVSTLSNGGFNLSGGRFDCAASSINSPAGVFNLTGGIFEMPSGTFTLGSSSGASSITRGPGSTLNHNNGTLLLQQSNLSFNGAAQDFNNVTVTTLSSNLTGTMRVLGTLNLQQGSLSNSGGVVEVLANMTVADTYGMNAFGLSRANLKILGNAARTITLPSGMPARFNPLILDAPNVLLNLSGAGTVSFEPMTFNQGSIETGVTGFDIRGTYTQNGGTFTCGGGLVNIIGGGGPFTLNGGIFDCAASNITTSNQGFVLNSGTFNLPSGNFTFDNSNLTRSATAIVNHSNGTFIPVGPVPSVRFNAASLGTGTQDFGNVTVNPDSSFTIEGTMQVLGQLDLQRGIILSGTLNAKGNVTVGNQFSGNSNQGTPNLIFSGTGDQTYTNNGVGNPGGTWTINKPSGTVTAATSLGLGASQPLNITGGTLYLNNNSNLTTGSLTIGANGKLVNESSTTITLGGNLLNSGTVDLQGGGAGCPENDSILIRSNSATQRSWSGGGRYRLVDVDVQNMVGTGTKNIFSGTNSGGNNSTWVFNAGCPVELSLTPSSVGVQTAATQTFTAGGGFGPYTFSIFTNNSVGSINASSGLYTAGTTTGVTDTVRVTDSFGATADANVTVFGVPNKLAFTVQPTNTVAGQAISPAVKVTVQDSFGNTVTNSTAAITLSIQNNPNGGTLAGTLIKNAVNGIATFDNLSINRAGDGYTLRAASGSLTAATSNAFNITVGAANQLAFVVQPLNTDAGAVITPAVQVVVQDTNGNTVTTANDAITIAIGNNPSSGTLSGTLARNAVDGVATFNNLSINNAGNDYTLTASSGALTPATSAAFNIISPFVVTNTNDSGAGSLRQAILNANAAAGTQTISFNIAGAAPFTIVLNSNLPIVSQPAVIDGTTQPGFNGAPVIELTKAAAVNSILAGIHLAGGNSTVKGLIFNRFFNGMVIESDINTIENNYIGTDSAGSSSVPNNRGVYIRGNANTLQNNIVSGNGGGIEIIGNSSNNLLQNNLIGLSVNGNPLGNTADGIGLRYQTAGNQNGNRISANRIAYNLEKGIELGFNYNQPRQNDPQDPDSGANGLQNNPVLNSATSSIGNTTIAGTFNSTPSQNFSLEFYSSPTCDASGYGEGETFLGSTNVTTDAGGIIGFTASLPVSTALGRVITATATDSNGNTSEFSRCSSAVTAVFSISGRITDSTGSAAPNVIVKLSGANQSRTTDRRGNYSFSNVPAGGNYTVQPVATGVTFSPASRSYPNLSASQFNQNFIATGQGRIGGRITRGVTSFIPIPGITVVLSGPVSRIVKSDNNGSFVFSDLLPGNFTVTPTSSNFTFAPSSATVSSTNREFPGFVGATNPPLIGRVVYNSSGDLRVMNADTSGDLALGKVSNVPSISRDGSLIAFSAIGCPGVQTSCATPVFRVYKINFDGSNKTLLPYEEADSSYPETVLSPDKTNILVLRRNYRQTNHVFKLLNAATGNLIRNIYTAPSGSTISNVSWSADGQKIAFARQDSSVSQIFTVNIDGSNLVQLTTNSNGVSNSKPIFSPDGTKIAFLRRITTVKGRAFIINADGTAETDLGNNFVITELAWSPDNLRIAYNRETVQPGTATAYGVMDANGTNAFTFSHVRPRLSWGETYVAQTPVGSNITTTAGSVSITFGDVSTAGETTILPIPPASVGTPPDGFVIGNIAYEITTTANASSPFTICFNVPEYRFSPERYFDALKILHREDGVLVDRTISRDFATTTICARTTSLSPFALAAQIIPDSPAISGVVIDSNGNPLSGVEMNLTGTESLKTQTDSDGVFNFVNLTAGGNYNVSPKQVGYLFSEYNQDFVNLTDEQTVVFEGAVAAFGISGQITDAFGNGVSNIAVEIEGSAQSSTVTDSAGNYFFAGLPADGFYTVTPADGTLNFSPSAAVVSPLTGDASGVDFTVQAGPTAANVSISGRILTPAGQGLRNAIVTLIDSSGRSRQVRSSSFGFYHFDDVEAGNTYVISVASKRYVFQPRTVSVNDEIVDFDLTGTEP